MKTQREAKAAEVAELRERLRLAEASLEKTAPEGSLAELAETLHSIQCNYSHEDQCSWEYEINRGVADWSRLTHKSYLEEAEKISLIAGAEVATEILKGLRG